MLALRTMNRPSRGGLLIVLALLLSQISQSASAVGFGPAPLVQRTPKGKRVYTNDDLPVSSAPPAPAEGSAAGRPVPGPTGEKIVPFVASPMEVVDRMLDVAGVTSKDVVYDMGSGDGRIVLRAAEKFGSRGVGVEIDHLLAVESAAKAKNMKLDKLVTIIEGDMFKTDLTPATVVTLYLVIEANNRLRPMLEKDLRPGTRVVVHDSRIPGWEATREETINVGPVPHTVYLYEIPGSFRRAAPR